MELIKSQEEHQLLVYTDGSCHTRHLTGAWAAIILYRGKKVVLSGLEKNTTHNRMELTAVINALAYVKQSLPVISSITIICDSQYVVGLSHRKNKLEDTGFTTKKLIPVRNSDLVKQLFDHLNTTDISFYKIKAHQKKSGSVNYNIEADMLSRKLVREAVKQLP